MKYLGRLKMSPAIKGHQIVDLLSSIRNQEQAPTGGLLATTDIGEAKTLWKMKQISQPVASRPIHFQTALHAVSMELLLLLGQ